MSQTGAASAVAAGQPREGSPPSRRRTPQADRATSFECSWSCLEIGIGGEFGGLRGIARRADIRTATGLTLAKLLPGKVGWLLSLGAIFLDVRFLSVLGEKRKLMRSVFSVHLAAWCISGVFLSDRAEHFHFTPESSHAEPLRPANQARMQSHGRRMHDAPDRIGARRRGRSLTFSPRNAPSNDATA